MSERGGEVSCDEWGDAGVKQTESVSSRPTAKAKQNGGEQTANSIGTHMKHGRDALSYTYLLCVEQMERDNPLGSIN